MESYRRDPRLPRIYLLNKEWTGPARPALRALDDLADAATNRQTLGAEFAQRTLRSDLAVFPNEFFVYAAYLAAKRLHLPFYLYFHNTYRESRVGNASALPNGLSRAVFARHARSS